MPKNIRCSYSLVILKDGEVQQLQKDPLPLADIDFVTTSFESQSQLLKILSEGYGIDTGNATMTITYKNSGYTKTTKPLFLKDKMILNERATIDKIMARALDRNFAIKLAQRYLNGKSKQIRDLSGQIIVNARNISKSNEYLIPLDKLLTMLCKDSYKTLRDVYLFEKEYSNIDDHIKVVTPKTKEELIEQLKKLKLNLMPLKQITIDDLNKSIPTYSEDTYLQALLEQGDMETIMNMYSNDQLQFLVDHPEKISDGLDSKGKR